MRFLQRQARKWRPQVKSGIPPDSGFRRPLVQNQGYRPGLLPIVEIRPCAHAAHPTSRSGAFCSRHTLAKQVRIGTRILLAPRLMSSAFAQAFRNFHHASTALIDSWGACRCAPPVTIVVCSWMSLVSTPIEICSICGGTGWKTVERGKEREAVRCDCRVSDRTARLIEAARVPSRYRHCEFDNFVTEHSESVATARLTSRAFVDQYPLDKTGLLFVGPVGTGKTHLAVAIGKELIRRSRAQCLFYDYRELLKSIQNSFNASVATTEMQVLEPVLSAEVLIFDELGAVRPTDWVSDTVNHIINIRYNESRTTIFTTNYPDAASLFTDEETRGHNLSAAQRAMRRETLGDRIGDRMWSRLHEMCRLIEINATDYRKTFNSARPTRKRYTLKRGNTHVEDPPNE